MTRECPRSSQGNGGILRICRQRQGEEQIGHAVEKGGGLRFVPARSAGRERTRGPAFVQMTA